MFGRITFIAAGMIWGLTAPLYADVSASILGNARDSSGAVLPNVKVTVTNVDTNLTKSILSDTSGEYRFLSLPVGTYRVEAELAQFQRFVADNLVLTVDQQRRVDITLRIGTAEQKVEVRANTVQVETASTQLGTVIEDRAMVNLL